MLCSACRRARPDDELLAYWPVGDPRRPRYVCRPSLGMPGPAGGRGSCFSTVVATACVHSIALVCEPCAPERRSVRPFTDDWFHLLAECGVRAA